MVAGPEICINFCGSLFFFSMYKCGFTLEQYQQTSFRISLALPPPFRHPPQYSFYSLPNDSAVLIPFLVCQISTNNSCLLNFFWLPPPSIWLLFGKSFSLSISLLGIRWSARAFFGWRWKNIDERKCPRRIFSVFILRRKCGLSGNLWVFLACPSFYRRLEPKLIADRCELAEFFFFIQKFSPVSNFHSRKFNLHLYRSFSAGGGKGSHGWR